MPQRKASLRSLRNSQRKAVYNAAVKEKVKKAIKNYLKSLQKNEVDNAKKLLALAYKELDKAARKNVIHRNKASRKKSRLSKKLATAIQHPA